MVTLVKQRPPGWRRSTRVETFDSRFPRPTGGRLRLAVGASERSRSLAPTTAFYPKLILPVDRQGGLTPGRGPVNLALGLDSTPSPGRWGLSRYDFSLR